MTPNLGQLLLRLCQREKQQQQQQQQQREKSDVTKKTVTRFKGPATNME